MANTGKFSGSAKDKVEDLSSTAGHYAQEAKTKAQDAASSVADKAKDAASSVASTAQSLAHKASDAASTVGHKAEDAVSGVGGQMKTLAGSIRENAPREGMVGSAASSVASSLESGGRYLQEHNFSGMADDLTGLIRRYPIQAIMVGLGVGFLFARATRR